MRSRITMLWLALLIVATLRLPHTTRAADNPLTITRGGTYSGSWESNDPNVPAVTITTSEPVVIKNATIRSRGHLIRGFGLDLTVRNTRGYALNPNVVKRAPGRFVAAEDFFNIRLENNYFEGTSGIYLRTWRGDPAKNQGITILRNRARNIDGRFSDGNGSFLDDPNHNVGWTWAQFVQFNDVKNVPNAEIAWNEVINEPRRSRVEDNVNLYESSGTPASPIRIHDNYIQGAYPADPSDPYSGGGILLGDGNPPDGIKIGYAHAYNNQLVSIANHGISIAAGWDNQIYNNRVVSGGVLADGTRIGVDHATGSYVWDLHGAGSRGLFGNNVSRDNLIGLVRWKRDGSRERSDWWLPNCATNADGSSKCTGNQSVSDPITPDTERAEFARWQQKIAANKLAIGPRTSVFVPLTRR